MDFSEGSEMARLHTLIATQIRDQAEEWDRRYRKGLPVEEDTYLPALMAIYLLRLLIHVDPHGPY